MKKMTSSLFLGVFLFGGLAQPVYAESDTVKDDLEQVEQKEVNQKIQENDFYFEGHTAPVEYTTAKYDYGDANILYQWGSWDSLPNYYLAEYVSPMGEVARSMEVGDRMYLYGEEYEVSYIEYNIDNDPHSGYSYYYTIDLLNEWGYDMVIQTCEQGVIKYGPIRVIILHKTGN